MTVFRGIVNVLILNIGPYQTIQHVNNNNYYNKITTVIERYAIFYRS